MRELFSVCVLVPAHTLYTHTHTHTPLWVFVTFLFSLKRLVAKLKQRLEQH